MNSHLRATLSHPFLLPNQSSSAISDSLFVVWTFKLDLGSLRRGPFNSLAMQPSSSIQPPPPSTIPTSHLINPFPGNQGLFTNRNFPYLPRPSEGQGEDSKERLPSTTPNNRRINCFIHPLLPAITTFKLQREQSSYIFKATNPRYSSYFPTTQQSEKWLLLQANRLPRRSASSFRP